MKSRKSGKSLRSKLSIKKSSKAEQQEPVPEPIDLSYREVDHKDNLTPNDLFKLRHYLAKKEKASQNAEANLAKSRRQRDANDDLQGLSGDGSKERAKATKGDANVVKYQKEVSHCLERDKYVAPRKVQPEKLPVHVQELLQLQDESLHREVHVEPHNAVHENYMESLRQIREQLADQQREQLQRQKQLE